jgi:anti-anti-sigma factor
MQQSAYGMTWRGSGGGPSPWLEFADRTLTRPYFRICSLNGLPVVTTPTDIDFGNYNQLTQVILDASTGATVVIVDMTATTFIDCTGLGALIRAYRRLEDNGIELRVATIDARTRWMMADFGFDRQFRIFDTLPEAVTARPKHWSLHRQAA